MKRQMVPGTPNLLRMVNRNTILFHLEQMNQTSRAELSQLTGLSPPTVSTVIRELIDEGWACEMGDAVSQGGKPRQMIQLNPNARRILAIQLNHQKIRIRMTNLSGKILHEMAYQPNSYSAETVVFEAATHIRHVVETANALKDVEILGLGVAVPGVVDDKGIVSNAPEFGWTSEPIYDLFAAHVNLPVVVENDVKLAALGDGWIRKCHNGTMVYVHLDHGIGAGILIDGSLYRGANFSAGEIANLIVDPLTAKQISENDGTVLGPFEAHYGLNALNNTLAGTVQEDELPAASEYILRHLAFGLTNIISLLDPHAIVFGGEMTHRIPDFIAKFSIEIAKYSRITPELYVTPLGQDASLFGAIRAVIDGHKSQVTWTTV